jgi:predicted ATP-grasp superfamily ATP-dependent carboligase
MPGISYSKNLSNLTVTKGSRGKKMKLQGTLSDMPRLETHFETVHGVDKPVALSLIMIIENMLELKIDIPWIQARELAKRILTEIEKHGQETELRKPK